VTSTTTPISATAEQEDDQNDNQDQFHGASPVDGDGYGAGTCFVNGGFNPLFPILLNFKIFPSHSAMTTDPASVGFCKPRYSVAIDAAKLESIFQFLASESGQPALNAVPVRP
jgi:hypothetical protein